MRSFNKKNLFLSLTLFSQLLTGCASTSKSSSENDTAAKTFATSETKGIVYLYRPGAGFGAALQTPIKINGLDAGGTGPGTYFKWELEPAKYTFSSSTSTSSAVVALDVLPGKLYFIKQDYKFDVIAGAKIIMEEADEAKGKKAVNKSKLLISTYMK
jgi:hypothetical protein